MHWFCIYLWRLNDLALWVLIEKINNGWYVIRGGKLFPITFHSMFILCISCHIVFMLCISLHIMITLLLIPQLVYTSKPMKVEVLFPKSKYVAKIDCLKLVYKGSHPKCTNSYCLKTSKMLENIFIVYGYVRLSILNSWNATKI